MWITSAPPCCMKKGGFSITSWPTLTITSAASMARWTKSPDDRAAQPTNLGPRSSMTPLPSWVVTNGIPVFSMNCPSIRLVMVRLAPAPMTSSGDLAASSRLTAVRTDFTSATGRRTWLAGMGTLSVSSWAMSSGSSRWTAPGFSSWARRNASRTRDGILSAEAIWWVYFVSGRIMSTTSRIWKRPCLEVLIGFWPVIISIGMPPSWA